MKNHYGSNGRSVCRGQTRSMRHVSLEWAAVTCVSCRRWVERYRRTGTLPQYFRARTGCPFDEAQGRLLPR